jgi:hypothetical protein
MTMNLKDAQDTVLREIGRNLLVYQRLEHTLKFLLARARVSGYTSTIQDEPARQSAGVQRKTMGQVAEPYFEQLYSEPADSVFSVPEALTEIWVTSTVHIEEEASQIEQRRKALSAIIRDRNSLAHNFIALHDLSSAEGCQAALDSLKQQRAEALVEIDRLNVIVDALRSMSQQLAEYMQSDEFLEDMRHE